MDAYALKSEAELSAYKEVDPPCMSGVEQSVEMLKLIWENFSAVAGGHPTFECWRMPFSSQPVSHSHMGLPQFRHTYNS